MSTTNDKRMAFFHRLLDEHRELDERNTRLGEFLHTLAFDVLDSRMKTLLLRQHEVQKTLLDILGERIYLIREQIKKDEAP